MLFQHLWIKVLHIEQFRYFGSCSQTDPLKIMFKKTGSGSQLLQTQETDPSFPKVYPDPITIPQDSDPKLYQNVTASKAFAISNLTKISLKIQY